MEEDRISCLPECLLIEIISRIKTKDKTYKDQERIMTTKEVIRTTATISKRWQHLWAFLPNLIFIDEYDIIDVLECNNLNRSEFRYNNDLTDYFSFIHKTLIQSPPTYAKLNEFKLYISFDSRVNPEFKSQVISWIRHAVIYRNMQTVDFRLWDIKGPPSQFDFDDALFFNNESFRKIKLRDCLLKPPNGVIRWENLEMLHLTRVRLDEDMIENIFSGTPCLEGLEFDDCYGYRRIDITSETLMVFTFNSYYWFDEYSGDEDNYIDAIEINAPHLLSLTIQGQMLLKKISLLNVSSLIKAGLIYGTSYCLSNPLLEEETLKGLLQSLSRVDDVRVGDDCLEVLSRLECKGFHFFEDTDDTSPDSNSSDSD